MRILKDKYVGETKGPSSREGNLGEAFSNLPSNHLEMIEFTPVKGRLQEVDASLLDNADQKYAYNLGMGIQKGYSYLLKIYGKKPPLPAKPHHARWIIDALYFMRIFIQTPNPCIELQRIVEIILNWYLPMYFTVKEKPHIVNAAKHFYQGIVWMRESFTQEEQLLVEPCFRRNSFMAHPESILLAGICDPDLEIREYCAKIIIEARKRDTGEVREFYPPNMLLELNANSYLEMVDLNRKSYVTPPPLLRNYDDETLFDLALEGKIEIPNIPCHSVNNERAVKDTSQASMAAIGIEKTHGHILNLVDNRAKIPTRHKKTHFVKKT